MTHPDRQGRLVRMFSSAIVSQALLSGASLAVSLILIRRTDDHQYGYYLLFLAGTLLLTSLQNSFYGPAMIERLTRYNESQRADLIGGLYREQRVGWLAIAVFGVIGTLGAWLCGWLNGQSGPLLLMAIVAALPALNREFFRSVLLAHRRSESVLKADFVYVVALILGAAVATLLPHAATFAVMTLGLAALATSLLLMRALCRIQPWNPNGAHGILKEIAPLALWSTAGALTHWSFSQGYSFLVASKLDVPAVAAIGAIRLLMMPINLISTGIGSLMLPLASRWLHDQGMAVAFKRLCLFAVGLACGALVYFGVLWLIRDWIFSVILKKQFAQRDLLLLLWAAASILMVIRDQLVFIPVMRRRFKTTTMLTAICAICALTISYIGIIKFGVVGALAGVVCGEMLNVATLIVLSLREVAINPGRPEHA